MESLESAEEAEAERLQRLTTMPLLRLMGRSLMQRMMLENLAMQMGLLIQAPRMALSPRVDLLLSM